jgi:hypothetical protein
MNIEKEIESILFNIGREITVHKVKDGHLILDIDYQKYIKEFIILFDKYKLN